MLKRVFLSITRFRKQLKMAGSVAAPGEQNKLSADDCTMNSNSGKRLKEDTDDESNDAKKAKFVAAPPMQGRIDRKRKVALLLAYTGEGYHGIQINRGVRTIEEDLIKALKETNLIPEEHAEKPQKMSFQRAARTDKGVSAAGQVVSLKMLLNKDVIAELNSALPQQIRVLAYRRTTKGFNSKNHCTGRTYLYVTPTYAFAPIDANITEEYRIDVNILKRVQEILDVFKGTHNFHNFTSGIKYNEACANRYIIDFECGQPFIQDGMEFVVISVHGQSFMMHQIRKMVGVTMAIVRGYSGVEVIQKAWQELKVDIPIAPGTGLLLDKVHYDGYNKKFGKDGLHEPVVWEEFKEQMEQFKRDYIFAYIVKAEKRDKVMMKWLSTLHFHNYDVREDGDASHFAMKHRLNRMDKEGKASESGESDGEAPRAPVLAQTTEQPGGDSHQSQPQTDQNSMEEPKPVAPEEGKAS